MWHLIADNLTKFLNDNILEGRHSFKDATVSLIPKKGRDLGTAKG